MKTFLKSIYIGKLFYIIMTAEIVLLVFGAFFPLLYVIGRYALILSCSVFLIDILILYSNKNGFYAKRNSPEKLSNGDQNLIKIYIENKYLFKTLITIIDELPFQFQSRNISFSAQLEPGSNKTLEYIVRPLKRGEYHFGALNIFVQSPIGFIQRKICFEAGTMIPVYPSYLQMRKYELLAISNRLTDAGIKRMRRIGNNSEFDQIKEYTRGDDHRTVNWKATARKNKLMVNQFRDERSQQVYSLIDMGRVMQMPFDGLSLLDYAINSSLVLSNIALIKSDKAGIFTFSNKVQSVITADRKGGHLNKILQLLYNQKTNYLESDFENLYINVKTRIHQRSLLLLYTNFESLSGLQRQLRYLRRLAKDHLLVLIFFENTELSSFAALPSMNTEDVYNKVIAEKLIYEKKLIGRELDKFNIHKIFTSPEKLTVNTINKYLELKTRGLI